MKKVKLALALACLLAGGLGAVTIYDIQYTANPGSGTYPSDYAGQYVSIQGVVTAYGYSGYYGYYISMPEGGAWKGILVYDNDNTPTPGTQVAITGQVWEYYGLTEIRNVSYYQVISAGNPIPPAVVVSTGQASGEPYEGVLMEVQNALVTQGLNQYGEWAVSDGSGNCAINDVFFDQSQLGALTTPGVLFDSIKGIGHYGYGLHSLNPRSPADLIADTDGVVVTLPNLQVPLNEQVTVPVSVSNLTLTQGFTSYQFQLAFDPGILSYQGFSTAGTLSANGTAMATPGTGHLGVSFVTNGILQGQGTLLNLHFLTISNGVTALTAGSFTFNETPVMLINQGLVTVGISGGETLDTLSVIQRPLLNIPQIVVPGETFPIECVAPPAATGWSAWLYKGNLEYSLPITNTQYVTDPPRWILTAQVPAVNVFELYDLRVTDGGGLSDRTRHSVQVLPSRRSSYYFAHITDLHLPTHIFYPDFGYNTDSTEVADFREVVRDINLIRPEFVLLTGDLVNQGELEEFENLRVYSKAKRLLGELEVPVYVTSGNHDIGGWPSTSPPAGSARRFWWKNFGWSWLDNTSASWPYHTQDYSFDYGPVHFTGLESYDNYDNYLPAVYGGSSYTAAQLQWLQADLAASGAETKVLFHHYDFQDQLNLNALDLDMALWGHIHYDSGSLASQPYNLSTRAVCNGYRSYRIIRVNGTELQPLGTISAGSAGNQLRISYLPDNYGYADSVSATAVNSQPIGFEHGLVKFLMPSGNAVYTVTGGTLEQVDRSGAHNVCYVRANLPAYSTTTVSIRASGTGNADNSSPVAAFELTGAYPNPFRDAVNLSLISSKAGSFQISVYNVKGELVKVLLKGWVAAGNQYCNWDGKDSKGGKCSPGIYLVRASDGVASCSRKLILMD